MQRSKIFFIIIFLGVLFTLAGYWFKHDDTGKEHFEEYTGQKETVRLAVAKAFITAPVLIALENNYFSDVGLQVEITGEFSSGKGSFDHMLAGKADMSTPATIPVVLNSFQRRDYSIFLTYLTTYEGIKVVARKDKQILSAADLKGKTIGMVPGTISEILIDLLLAYHKILSSEVTMKAYKGHELPGALKLNEVDAISVWEPHAYHALNLLPEMSIRISTSQVYRIAVNMAVMNDFANRHPEVLIKVIRALDKAIKYMNTETDQSQAILARKLDMDRDLVNQFWQEIDYKLSLDQLLVLTMENEARWVSKQSEPAKELPNYLDYIIYQPLETFDPEAVTLIRKIK
ncbi:ABC transporter substrate-binding protein [bacterium]|nr:ABC transporter substrate-binding protein [bacterium]